MRTKQDINAVTVYFNIAALNDCGYGEVAHCHIFRILDERLIREIHFYSGDSEETLNGNANEYCVSLVGSRDSINEALKVIEICSPVTQVKEGVEVIQSEPLVYGGSVDEAGNVINAHDGSWLWWMYPEQARAHFGSWSDE